MGRGHLAKKKKATAGDEKLHVVMFPWLAFGHMIPYLELSKFIATKGHRVSFISTPRNIQRLPKLPPNLADFIYLVKLPLPHVDGLPDQAEATTDVPPSKFPYLKKAFDGLETDLTHFLQTSAPDWIIYDFAPYWLPPITGKLGILSAFFMIINAWFLAFLGPASAMIDGSDPRTEPEHFTVRPKWVPFPSNVAYRLHEAKWMAGSKNVDCGVSNLYRSGSTIFGCDVIAVRHCREFEPDWLKLLEELHQKPVLPVGLMPPSLEDGGDEKNETWLSISEWLDQQNSGSVVYIALGSEVTLSQEQLTELSLGLELSGLPFFWALRKPAGSDELDPLELPGGFEERTKGRGLVWTSWVPQLRLLAHESVGGFLTHCGWSSTVEGLQFGLPLIMLPFLVDQGLNARVLDEKKVGVEIPRDERDGSFTRNSVADSLKLVMADDEGKIFRERAKEISAIFGDKVLHDQYLDNFVEYLENRRRLHEGGEILL